MGDDWAEKVEKAAREAIRKLPGLSTLPEVDYCEAVIAGLTVIIDGAEMRIEELEDEEDDEDDDGLR